MCVPCIQTQIWNNMAAAKLNSVTALAQSKIDGSKPAGVTEAWLRRWYEQVEAACEGMDKLLAEITTEGPGK